MTAEARGVEAICFLQDAAAAVAAVDAADRLGVLARLERGPAEARVLARECGLDERGAHWLLTALGVLGLISLGGDGSYRLTVLGLARVVTWRNTWDCLDDVLRTGRPWRAADTPAGAAQIYPKSVRLLATLLAPIAEQAADHLSRPGLRILDLGVGAAPWSLALAARDPSSRVTAVDLPEVIPTTRDAVAAAGRAEQFSFLPGNLFDVDWGEAGYDLAIVGNVCHLFDGPTNRRLFLRVAGALRPGGEVAILDILPDEDLAGPRSAILYGLGLLLRTATGGIYPFSAYASWLYEAGFEQMERVNLTSSLGMSLVTARVAG